MQSASIQRQNSWHPFQLGKPDLIRPLSSPLGVEDRLRVVAFAELQARDLFLWGAERFGQAPADWRDTWVRFAAVEDRHAQMLLTRMAELGVDPGARKVSDKLSRQCFLASDPVVFLFMLASAEERGMEAGNILGRQMKPYDPVSAAIFDQIAQEEVEHVEMAKAALAGKDLDDLKRQSIEYSKRLETSTQV